MKVRTTRQGNKTNVNSVSQIDTSARYLFPFVFLLLYNEPFQPGQHVFLLLFLVGGMVEFRKRKNEQSSNNEQNRYHRYLNSVEVYDSIKNEWTLLDAKMKNRRCGCSTIVIGSRIMVFGGWDDITFVSAIETFDVTTQKWAGSHIPPPANQRAEFAAIATQNNIFLIGGCLGYGTKKGKSSSVEIFQNAQDYLTRAQSSNWSIPESNERSNLNTEKEKIGVIRGQKKMKVVAKPKMPLRRLSRRSVHPEQKYMACRVAKKFNKVLFNYV